MTRDPRSDSDTGEQLTGAKRSLNIPFPAWLLVLVVIVVWLFGLGMEHGPSVFDIGAAKSGYDRYLTVLGSQSTAGLWISGVIALLLLGIFALVRKLRDSQLPDHSSRLFLVMLVRSEFAGSPSSRSAHTVSWSTLRLRLKSPRTMNGCAPDAAASSRGSPPGRERAGT